MSCPCYCDPVSYRHIKTQPRMTLNCHIHLPWLCESQEKHLFEITWSVIQSSRGSVNQCLSHCTHLKNTRYVNMSMSSPSVGRRPPACNPSEASVPTSQRCSRVISQKSDTQSDTQDARSEWWKRTRLCHSSHQNRSRLCLWPCSYYL